MLCHASVQQQQQQLARKKSDAKFITMIISASNVRCQTRQASWCDAVKKRTCLYFCSVWQMAIYRRSDRLLRSWTEVRPRQ